MFTSLRRTKQNLHKCEVYNSVVRIKITYPLHFDYPPHHLRHLVAIDGASPTVVAVLIFNIEWSIEIKLLLLVGLPDLKSEDKHEFCRGKKNLLLKAHACLFLTFPHAIATRDSTRAQTQQ